MIDDADEYTLELALDERWERRRAAELARHPQCDDPEHPGCEWCENEEM